MGVKFSPPVQTGSDAHPAFYTKGTRSFPGVKRPGRGVDHSPPSSAEVKERVELYLYSPWNLLHCTGSPPTVTRWLPYFWKIYASLFYYIQPTFDTEFSLNSFNGCRSKTCRRTQPSCHIIIFLWTYFMNIIQIFSLASKSKCSCRNSVSRVSSLFSPDRRETGLTGHKERRRDVF